MITATIPLEQYQEETSKWKNTVESLQNKVGYLEEQLEWFKKQIFGKKSEKIIESKTEVQLCFEGFDKLVETSPEKKVIPAHERAKRKPTGKDKIVFSSIKG